MQVKELLNEQTEYQIDNQQFKSILTPQLRRLDQTFDSYGYEVRIVGGAVRDILLGKTPKDIDLATDATPEEMMGVLDREGIKYIATGLQHGTITAVLSGEHFEITTLRTEREHTGRHATVDWTRNWKEDARRRDLTMNAMSLSLDGTLYDYFSGVDDLESGQVRFVGEPEERIREDYLRILRYFRFHSKYRDTYYPTGTEDAIEATAAGLKNISGERIWSELKQILVSRSPGDTLEKMHTLNVSQAIGLPVRNTHQVETLAKYDDPILSLSAMLDYENEVKRLDERYKFSSEERDKLTFLVKRKSEQVTEAEAKEMLTDGYNREWIYNLMLLQGNTGSASKIQRWTVPTFPVTGKDLISMGMKPGPELGRTLRKLKDEWQASNYTLERGQLLNRVSVDQG